MKIKVAFLGTPNFVFPVRECIKKNFELSDLGQKVDLIVVASYGKILTEKELKLPKFGAINIHPSKLPKFRGPSPIQTQILEGVKESAITFIKMDEEIDHGPILKTIPFEIKENDTFESAANKAFKLAADKLPQVINDFVEGKIKPVAQKHEEASTTQILKREDGFFDINNPPPPETLERKIRAFYPWPGVWAKIDGRILKFLPNKIMQIEGKKPVSLDTFMRGYPKYASKVSNLLSTS